LLVLVTAFMHSSRVLVGFGTLLNVFLALALKYYCTLVQYIRSKPYYCTIMTINPETLTEECGAPA